MIIDEALGALVYLLKRDEVLGPGPAFTAHLGVDYKKVKLQLAPLLFYLLVRFAPTADGLLNWQPDHAAACGTSRRH